MKVEKNYSIAGLNVVIEGEKTAILAGKTPGFNVFETGKQPRVDVKICVDQQIDPEKLGEMTLLHSFNVLEIDHYFCTFEGGYFFEMKREDGSLVMRMVYEPEAVNRVVMTSCDCEMSLKFALWVAYSFVAINYDIIPIHSSSVVKDDGVVLFLGESGTGKSTHTRLWLEHIGGAYLLNDDCPIVRIYADRVVAYGSPWSGKTHCYHQEVHPLRAMVRLSQGPKNVIKKLNMLVSIGAVYPSCPPLFAYDKALGERMMQALGRLLAHTPIYALSCLPDREAAEVSFSTIYM